MESIKKLLRTPSALALIIVALITLIGVIIQTNSSKEVLKLSIDATSTAEAKPTPVVQEMVITQIVTQLVEVSPTPIPASIALNEDFTEQRNDGLGLQNSTDENLITSVSGGHFVAEINAPYLSELKIVTENQIRNFDFIVKIAEVQGEVYLSLRFRRTSLTPPSTFNIYASGKGQGDYSFYSKEERVGGGQTPYNKLSQIRISCINDKCTVFLNGSENPIKTFSPVFDPSGEFKLGFSGTGTIRIDEITILELH